MRCYLPATNLLTTVVKYSNRMFQHWTRKRLTTPDSRMWPISVYQKQSRRNSFVVKHSVCAMQWNWCGCEFCILGQLRSTECVFGYCFMWCNDNYKEDMSRLFLLVIALLANHYAFYQIVMKYFVYQLQIDYFKTLVLQYHLFQHISIALLRELLPQ